MPLQNRVDPWGRLQAVSAHGAMLGNRGVLHDEQKNIVRTWRSKAWITCQLRFEGITRAVFSPDSYSELFFLDEATAFSAGHRPCADCRRERFREFKSAWIGANREKLTSDDPTIAEIDNLLQAERTAQGVEKITFAAKGGELPPGTFIEIDGEAMLIWRGKMRPWTFEGYGKGRELPLSLATVRILTPATVVRVFATGFAPQVHVSAYS